MKTEANAASAAKVPPTPPPCCQPIVAIVTRTMSTKAQLLWGDGGAALHLLLTQFSFQASVLRLFLNFCLVICAWISSLIAIEAQIKRAQTKTISLLL